MAWWDDLWLNEAFATFMADEIVDAWRPATGARLQALATKSQVMSDDSLATARRIRQPVRSTSEAQEAFDSVTYAKGRAVLAMTEAWLGPDVFRAGLRGYLQRHEWGNATADDLYASLGEASGGRDVAGVMRSFTDQIGVPIVDARFACPRGESPDRHACTSRSTGRSSAPATAPRCGASPSASPSRAGRAAPLHEAVHGADGARSDAGAGRRRHLPHVRVRERRRDRLLPRAHRAGGAGGAGADASAGCRSASASASSATPGRPCAPASCRCRRSSSSARGSKNDPSRLVWTEMLDALSVDRSRAGRRTRRAPRSRASCARCAARRRGASAGASRGDAARRRALHARGDPDRARRSRRGRPDAGGGGRGRARAWLESPAGDAADLARIALPLAAKRGDAALFDRCWRSSSNPPTPEARVLALGGLAGVRRSGADRAHARRWCSTARSGRRICATCSRRSACGRAGRDVVHAWIEKHFDELARLFPSYVMGRVVRAVAGAVRRGPRPRRRDVPAAARREAGRRSTRTCASRWRRGCAAPRSPTRARAEAARWLRGRL